MYENYYGLADNPFKITPNPRYLWYSAQHQEARGKVLYYILQSAGPIVLAAPIGTGKTSIARDLHLELRGDNRRKVVYLATPKSQTTNAFLRFIMMEFGADTNRAYAKSLSSFMSYLTKKRQEKQSCILLLDEAQNMTADMLHLIQHLFNFSTSTQFLIQMALFGQPEVLERIQRLKALKSRMAIAKLRPFDAEGTRKMMTFRWKAASGETVPPFPFTEDGVRRLHDITGGVPREIVKLANEALVRGAVSRVKQIDGETISQAYEEMTFEL